MTDPSPIVIIGAARSGTTFLRDVLAAADGVQAVPFDVDHLWRHGAGSAPNDALDPTTLTEARASFIRTALREHAKARPGDILLEKSLSNALRIAFVDKVLPGARYIHIVRDGRDVAESAMRQWQAPPNVYPVLSKLRRMPRANYAAWYVQSQFKEWISSRKGRKNIWGPRYPGIADHAARESLAYVCARQWAESVNAARSGLAALPGAKERVIEIRYERLLRDENVLHDIVARFGVPDAGQIVATYRDRLHPPAPAAWRSLPAKDRETFEQIMGPALAINGYVP